MIVFVHGGVWSSKSAGPASVHHAVQAGLNARDALDAVETAVCVLEDDERFNAGYGSVLNVDGSLELDAGIADGSTGRTGAVIAVTVRHPISLARRVLEDTPHVLMTGAGAAELGSGMAELHDTSPAEQRRWLDARERGEFDSRPYGDPELDARPSGGPEPGDTVGAVALDATGQLAAGSSTGGVFGQQRGRVGDSPLFGAGFYASARAAVVGTGVGELFIETLACGSAGRLIDDGVQPQTACERVLAELGRRASTSAGLLALDAAGEPGAAYRGAAWSVAGPSGPITPVRVG